MIVRTGGGGLQGKGGAEVNLVKQVLELREVGRPAVKNPDVRGVKVRLGSFDNNEIIGYIEPASYKISSKGLKMRAGKRTMGALRW